MMAVDPMDQGIRHVRQIDEIGENRSGHEDQIQHGGDRARLVHAANKPFPGQPASRQCKQKRENGRGRSRLVDGENAAIDAEEDSD